MEFIDDNDGFAFVVVVAVVDDDNFGILKQVRRIKWRELDFDGRITPGLEISARNIRNHEWLIQWILNSNGTWENDHDWLKQR